MKTVDSKKTSGVAMRAESPFFAKENGQGFFDAGADRKSFFPSSGYASPVQAKLNIGRPDDAYEKEADAVADKVIQAPSVSNGDQPVKSPAAPQVQQKCSTCEKEQKPEDKIEPGSEDKKLQRKPIFESNAEHPEDKSHQQQAIERRKTETVQKKSSAAVDPAPATASAALESGLSHSRGSGQPLPKQTREEMETSMGADFSGVRVHHDAHAEKMSRELNAQAFTHGSDIYFNSGKYNTQTPAGRHLLAHELTHTVQQDHSRLRSSIQRMPVIQKEGDDDKKDIKDLDAAAITAFGEAKEGYVKKNGTKLEVHFKDFRAKQYASPFLTKDEKNNEYISSPPFLKPTAERKTKQGGVWRSNALPLVIASINALITEKQVKGPTYQLTVHRSKKVGLTGSVEQIAKAAVVPFWGLDGLPVNHQIEHKVDWQIAGGNHNVDVISNLILLNDKENIRIGQVILATMKKYYTAIHAFYKSKQVQGIVDSFDEAKGEYAIYTDNLVSDPQAVKGSLISISNMDPGKTLNPLSSKLVDITEEAIPPGSFSMKTSEKGGGNIVPYNMSNEFIEIKGDAAKHNLISMTLKNVIKDDKGVLDTNNPDKTLTFIKEAEQDHYRVKTEGFAATLKDIVRGVKGMSPIEWEDIDFSPETGWSATGKIKTDIELLDKANITIELENSEFTIQAVIESDVLKGKLPKPFNIDYSSITISAGTKNPFTVTGAIGFSIEKAGKGHLAATAGVNQFGLEGKFNFDQIKSLKKAELGFKYLKKKGEESKWEVSGELAVDKGAIKGIDSASVKISYDGSTLSGDGNAKLTIPGIDTVKLGFAIGDNGDFTFTGEVELKKLPGIKSGKVSATVTSKAGEDMKLGIAGEAEPDLPKVPGLEGLKLTISWQDGIFEIRTKVIYKKGKFDGTIEVGVTNKQVDDKGKPLGEASEKGEMVVFGYGEVGVDIYTGVHGTVSIRLTPERDVLIGGKIEVKEIKPFGDGFNYDKEIIPFPQLEIPLIGIPGMSVSAFIKGGVHFKFSWDPLVLKDLSVEFKETDINQLETASIEIIGSVGSSAHAEVYLAINAGLKARVLIATLTGTLGGEAGLGLDAEAGGKVDAIWDLQKGLKFKEIRAFLNVTPKAVFRLTGDVSVDLDLWITSVNLYYHKWILAEKQLDLSGITLKVDFPIKFDEEGHVQLPEYDKMNVEKPNFSGESGKQILDDAINGDAKKEEEAKKEQIRQQIKTDMHSADNKDVSPSEYTEKMMDKYEKSPDLQVFVKNTIADEAKKMEYEHFEEQKQIIRSAKVPLPNKFTLLNMFMMFHAYIAEADVEAFKGELTRQDEEQKRQQALAANAGTPPDGNTGSSTDPNAQPPVQKKAAFESEEEETISGKAEDGNTGVAGTEDPFTEKLDAARSNGSVLPANLRESMESRMGADFGNVRIHDDAESNDLSKQIHAQAFTTGNDIFFGAGKYDPASKQGQHLLAHELTHVLQQEGGGIRTKIQRHPVAPTKVERKTQGDIFGVGALPGMDLDAFKQYTGAQADWFVETTLTAGDRNDLWKLLFKTRPGSPIMAGVSDIPVKELRTVTDAQWTGLEVYCRGCDSAGHTIRLHPGGALADRITLGGILKVLETGIPGIVLEATMTELQLKKIQTDGLLIPMMAYLLTFHPHLQETVGSAAGLAAGTRSETQMLLDFVKAPGMLAFLPLLGRVRNLHRFAPDALLQLQNNFADFSHTKPLYLILYSGHDYDSAFIRSQALFESILKDRSKLVLMLEGQGSLQDIIDKVPKIATDYGQPDAGGVNRIAQVMIAGHGSSQSVEMAGSGVPSIDAEGKVQYQTEDLDLDKNNAQTVKLLEVLMENLNPATARVVYAGCLVGSTAVPVKDAGGVALGAADITREVNNPARKSLAATTRDIAVAKGRGGAVVEGSRASVGLKASNSLMDAAGNFHVDYTFDPTAFGNANVYVATGKEPEGLLRAAVEVAAVNPVVAANQLRTRSLIPPRDAWYDPVTLALVKEALDGVAPGAAVDIVKVNQLATMAPDFFLSYWAGRSIAFFGSEVNVNPVVAANLYTAVTAIPAMAAPAKQETKEGRFILELGWSMLNPARSGNVIAYLDARAELTTTVLAKHLDIPWLNSVAASASLFPPGAAASDGRIRLALAWMQKDNNNADVKAFLNGQVNVAGPRPRLQPNIIAQLSSPADEEGILSALGRLVPVVPGVGGAKDLPAANADAFPGKAPAMNDVRVESNPYVATVIPPAFVLNVRKQPTMKGEPFHWLKRGETVKVMGFVHQWAAVDINGKLGFAHGNFLSAPPL